ncbi:hypothetical protein [Streptomyces sp. ML-6]|uniref:hypothetical protein n=1 Tax=Streptomyces sp. ML-6 TaxID=2982693 RepID=UPI0024BFC63A|nr:hypothetical protein [Streptomyces sp. ML-6]MDK0522649.1 hypothetical protein [Streptomyces sp. ML-6]
MARLLVRTGVNPDEPDVSVVTLLVDPAGSPGERAVALLGGHCVEGDGAFFLMRTDGWAEHALDGDRLTVAVAVYPSVLGRAGADAAGFAERSSVDSEAVVVLREETVVAPELFARLAPMMAVYTADRDRTHETVPASDDDWPVLLGLFPQ